MNLKRLGLPVLSLVLICSAAAFALAFAHSVTQPVIENLRKEKEELIKQRFPGAESFEDLEIPEGAENIGEITRAILPSGVTAGYAVTATARGYGGKMGVTVALDADGTVKSVSILYDGETKGIGSRVKDGEFLSRFEGKAERLKLGRGASGAEDEIAAVSGATVSSRAVTDAVNSALECYKMLEAAE